MNTTVLNSVLRVIDNNNNIKFILLIIFQVVLINIFPSLSTSRTCSKNSRTDSYSLLIPNLGGIVTSLTTPFSSSVHLALNLIKHLSLSRKYKQLSCLLSLNLTSLQPIPLSRPLQPIRSSMCSSSLTSPNITYRKQYLCHHPTRIRPPDFFKSLPLFLFYCIQHSILVCPRSTYLVLSPKKCPSYQQSHPPYSSNQRHRSTTSRYQWWFILYPCTYGIQQTCHSTNDTRPISRNTTHIPLKRIITFSYSFFNHLQDSSAVGDRIPQPALQFGPTRVGFLLLCYSQHTKPND